MKGIEEEGDEEERCKGGDTLSLALTKIHRSVAGGGLA